MDTTPSLHSFPINPQTLIENRAVTTCLPSSPIRPPVFNFQYPPPPQMDYVQYSPATPYGYSYAQTLPYLGGLYQPLLNNNYTLQPPPQKKLSPSPISLRRDTLQVQGPALHVQGATGGRQPSPDRREPQFIKPLSQIGTLTTTDPEGRLRVLVPVTGHPDEAANLMTNLRLGDELRVNGPAPITRSTSEKVPNRSELMSQVQRTMWARHTTK